MGEIVWLGRYPVKSMLGEELTQVTLDDSGVMGDRRYALIDQETGLIASAKYPRKWRSLLQMSARWTSGQPEITLPDGTIASQNVDAELSQALGRRVRLIGGRPDGALLERVATEVDATPGALTQGRLAAGTPGNTFVDFGPVHVVTTATLQALAAAHPHQTVDSRRFRANIIIRMFDGKPFAENDWPGQVLRTREGTALRLIAPTPRCPVPTLAQGNHFADDPDLLRTASRLNRVPVLDLGTFTCVGGYGAVEQAGRLRIGDVVSLT